MSQLCRRRRMLTVLVVLLAMSSGAVAVQPSSGELQRAHEWVQAKFLAQPTTRPVRVGLEVRANYGSIQLNGRDGQPLKIGTKQFKYGLFCHATSEIRVGLPGPGAWFSSQVGIDTNGSWVGGSAVFSVCLNGQPVSTSEVCRRGDAPRSIKVDLAGATEFTLAVGDAGDNINSDQADWAEAVVTLADGTDVRVADLPLLGSAEDPPDTNPPFSFTLGGRSFCDTWREWKCQRTSKSLDDKRVQHEVTWQDPLSGLQVKTVAIEYTDYPAIEWTLYFRNTGSVNTPVISNIRAVETDFKGRPDASPILHSNTGDLCTPDSYQPHAEPIGLGIEKRIANTGGRPTQSAFPYFNLAWPDRGIIVVLSWAGQWVMNFAGQSGGDVQVNGGQETTHFTLHPAEQVRGPMVVVQFYSGDWLRGQNLWRRWLVDHNLPRPGGSLVQPMVSVCTGNYYPGLMSNAAQELAFLRQHVANGIRFDGWWQDAGWYPCDEVTWPKTGTWEVDRRRFPNGLREVSDYVHSQGAKSIVWFEPERVHAGTWLAEQHPEWVHGGKSGGLLRLDDAACRDWLINHVDRMLTDEAIDVYRQDFNIEPLDYWRAADSPDRQGITEIRHVEGYLAYWDELIKRHPGLLIDSCASGGRRNDLETLRRAVPLLRSDWYQSPDGQQCHTYGLSMWFPYQGTAGCLYHMMESKYWMRSQMVAEFTIGPESHGLEGVNWDLLRSMIAEWRRVSECLYGDFYPLTSYSLAADCWMAWQYDLPEAGRGAVQAFRRGESIYESARIPLHGLDAAAEYLVTDLDSGKALKVSGNELLSTGVRVEFATRPAATTIVYTRQ